MVGGTIIEIRTVSSAKVWLNVRENTDRRVKLELGIYVNPMGYRLRRGDSIWWQGGHAMWTPMPRTDKVDVKLPRYGTSGAPRPDPHA